MSESGLNVPTDLRDLVQISKNSVVSHTLVKSRAGTVTAFAFDAGEGLSEHTAPFDALVQGLEGEATVTVAGKAQTLSAGRLLRLPANVPHALQAVTPFKMLLIMIRAQEN